MTARGELVVVATPIGNLGDLSPRAAETLARADVICCEDTRRTGLLLSRAGIEGRRLLSLHGHNERRRAGEVIGLVEGGSSVAVVTDAGTPAVSDPGARVVDAAHEAGVRVRVVPGPSAATAAISVAGFVRDRWCYEGFLPRKGGDRRARLAALASAPVPSVVYEAPGRVDALVSDLLSRCDPARLLAVCRELSKLHEEIWRGPIGEAVGRWPAATAKGEFVLVLDAAAAPRGSAPDALELTGALAALLVEGRSRRDAVAELADRFGLARREVYELLGPRSERDSPTSREQGGL